MLHVFTICAVAGGTILLCQMALTLIGIGVDSVDGPEDLGGATDHPLDGSGDVSEMSPDGHHAAWFFSVLSFRSLVAATTFFGLGGLAADAAELRPAAQWILALAAGGGAMYGVAWLLQSMRRLASDGTVRIERAIGQQATVYVPIAPHQKRAGKVHLKLQDRLVEYEAVTSAEEALPTGARVRVVGLIGSRLQVEPLPEHQAVAS